MNQMVRTTGRSPFQQLLILEERVKLSGSTLPKTIDSRVQWTGVRSRIAGTDCILRLHDIAELLDNPRITPIPRCADWVRGAINLRGRILPVYSIADYFKLSTEGNATGSRVVVVEKGHIFCGLVVEKVFGMQKFYQEHFTEFDVDQSAAPTPFNAFIAYVTKAESNDWYLLNLVQLAKKLYETNPASASRKQ
jgi:twitching motility protein PilI